VRGEGKKENKEKGTNRQTNKQTIIRKTKQTIMKNPVPKK
jgi:hypothetical protein